MLRYAGYIEAANHYELPRPPRRGSHRPEVPPLQLARAAFMSPRAAGGSPPLPFLVGAAPLSHSGGVSSYSLLGKRAFEPSSPTFSTHVSMRFTICEQLARGTPTSALALRDALSGQRSSSSSSSSMESARGREPSTVKQELCLRRDQLLAAPYPVKATKADATRAAETSPASVDFAHKVVGTSSRSRSSKEPCSPRRSILESYARTILQIL